MINENELSKMSGEQHYKRVQFLRTKVYRLNGETGKFQFVEAEDKDWKWQDVGNTLLLTFIRPRRQLVDWKNGMRTSEHNSPTDFVHLRSKTFGTEKGIAKDLREKYPELRTEQIIYSLKDDEIIKLIVKGSSLGSENKAEDTVSYFEYLNSFGKDEHIWQYETILETRIETSKMKKSYYVIHFKKGRKLSEGELENVSKAIIDLHSVFEQQDSFYGTSSDIVPALPEQSQDVFDELPSVSSDDPNTKVQFSEPLGNLEEKEIRPEDLPF